jgi:hypothetical protein
MTHKKHHILSTMRVVRPTDKQVLQLILESHKDLQIMDLTSHSFQTSLLLCRRNSKIHLLPHFKLYWSPFAICPTLLSILCCISGTFSKVICTNLGLVIIFSTISFQRTGDLHFLQYNASYGAILILA